MATECIAQVRFKFEHKGKPVVAAFDMAHASSDGGAVVLKGIDTHLGLTKRTIGSGALAAREGAVINYHLFSPRTPSASSSLRSSAPRSRHLVHPDAMRALIANGT